MTESCCGRPRGLRLVLAACGGLALAGCAPASPDSSRGTAYVCSRDAYNCSDFGTHAAAQAAYEACGGACEGLP